MGKYIHEGDDEHGYVEYYFMSREDAERAKHLSEYVSVRDSAAQICALMDSNAALVAAVKTLFDEFLPSLEHYYNAEDDAQWLEPLRAALARAEADNGTW